MTSRKPVNMSRRRAEALIRMAEAGIRSGRFNLQSWMQGHASISVTEQGARALRELDETAVAAEEAIDLIRSRYLGNVDVQTVDPTLWEDGDGPTDQQQPPPEPDPRRDL